jgi:hypothetical protein
MRALSLLAATLALFGAEKYSGPKPSKPDIPYLVHANKLVETETVEAREQQGKNGNTFTIAGASSSARTPLAEPVFIIESDHLNVNAMELYRLDVKGGNREIVMANKQKRRGGGPRPMKLAVQKVGERLYKIEAAETLEPGEYSLSPSDSNKAFCFEVY